MSKQVVLLFAGQGAQVVGMGQDLPDQSLFAEADATLGYALSETMFRGPMEELTRTSRCQPALYVQGLALLRAFQARVPDLEIVAAAGLSLGEFTAHAAAGTFDVTTGLTLVARRGLFMEEACDATHGSMLAMLGGEESAVQQLAADCDVDMANFNTPGQIVLSGTKENIVRAAGMAKERGLRGKELPVAGAYHSRLMASAQAKLAAELAPLQLQAPKFPVIANLTAAPATDPTEIRRTLEHQVTGSVRWAQSMQYLLAQGHDHFLELGPGKTLAGMMNRIQAGTKVTTLSDAATLEKAVEEFLA